MNRDALAETDIADHALNALSGSGVEEVVIIGRRGLRDAAYTAGEFLALGQLDGVDIIIERGDLDESAGDVERAWMLDIAREFAARPTTAGHRRIVFRFHTSPTAVVGESHATGLRVRSDGAVDEELESSMILRSIGYRGTPLGDLPVDSATGVMLNAGGRVLDDATPVPGVYVTGWIKRGPRGVIGTNRSCAEETVTKLLSDFESGRLTRESLNAATLQSFLSARGVRSVDWSGWRSIDTAERHRGKESARPRVKFVTIDELLGAAAGSQLQVGLG
jgi:ferredoxin--NADP+ reductase